MAVPRSQSAAVTAPDGNIYVIAGYDWSQSSSAESNFVDVYNPNSNKWQPRAAPMPTPRRCLAAVLGSDNKIYAIGGLGGVASLPNVEAFDPAANSWNASAPLATGRWYLGAAAAGNKIYSVGGFIRMGPYQAGNPNVSAIASVEEGTIL